MLGRRHQRIWFAAALLVAWSVCAPAGAQQVNTIREAIDRISSCWKPPPASQANPIDITVIVSFKRSGEILGRPRITYESEVATDNDRLQYRIAVMDALQRCSPMPFTESMGGAIAGRPFAIQFRNRKPPPQAIEKRAWLTAKTPKTL